MSHHISSYTRRRFRTYFEVFRINLKAQLIYRFDLLVSVVFTSAAVIFAYILWKAIFGQNQTVSSFTFSSMLSYYIINSFMCGLDRSNKVSEEICAQVMKGTFSKYMVLPINIQGYFMARCAGAVVFHLLFNLAAAIIWVFVFGINFTLTAEPQIIVIALLMYLLGLIFMVQFHYFIGILSFKYTSVSSFRIIASNIVEFAAGTYVPLILLPDLMLNIMRLLPFYYTAYLPSMLMIGRSREEVVSGLLIMITWVLGFALLNKITYKRMRLLYEGVGI